VIIRESLASAWATKVPSALVVIVAAAMCFVSLATVGRTAANEAAVRASFEQAGGRTLVVRDQSEKHEFINPRALGAVNALSTVELAVTLGTTFDSTNGRIGRGGALVPTWPVQGDLTGVVQMVRGRLPQAGEAVISALAQAKLGLAEPIGFLQAGANQYPIVGQFDPVEGFTDFAAGAVVNNADAATGVEMRVMLTSIAAAQATQTAVVSLIAPRDPQLLSVESPAGVAELTRIVGEQLSGFGRNLLALILGVGGLFVAVVVLADVLIRRRDLGRRRTLGVTRADLTILVTLRAVICALMGSVLGCAVEVALDGGSGHLPPLSFVIAVALLTVITAGVTALAPAFYAARLDPVRVMRTP
jgi:putative ABC transport system permease protein